MDIQLRNPVLLYFRDKTAPAVTKKPKQLMSFVLLGWWMYSWVGLGWGCAVVVDIQLRNPVLLYFRDKTAPAVTKKPKQRLPFVL